MKRFLALLLATTLLSGCAASESAEPAPTASESQSAEAPEETVELTAEEIITASHEQFFAQGMTERVASGGDNYILTYAPTDEFVAALYNETFDDVISVNERGMFTVLTAYDLLESGEASINMAGNLITIESETYGAFEVTVENGLIVSGRDLADSWSGTFEYQPDEPTLLLLQGKN